jgi:serine phosphatase RsbU (regulator of sigma subunit)
VETISAADEVASAAPLIEWGIAARALAGNTESGDQCWIESFPGGVAVAVVDALGHGSAAAAVARIASAALEGHAYEPITSLIRRCHEALLGTRGVVVSLASFDLSQATVTWLGVGNVKGLFLRAGAESDRPREALFLRGGVVGYHLPSLYPAAIPVASGDVLIFATDGIRDGFSDGLPSASAPQQMAEQILAAHARGTDDALVLVVRYVGKETA